MQWNLTADGEVTVQDGTEYRIAPFGSKSFRIESKRPHGWSPFGSVFDSADAAKADLADIFAHRTEVAGLGRQEKSFAEGKGTWTPWGPAQHATAYKRGVIKYGTAGHGGFHLSATVNDRLPEHLRNPDGWYEEDCEWAKVATALPELFTRRERRFADETMRNSYPDAWEAHHGRELAPGESRAKDEKAFYERHKDDWLAIAASRETDDTVKVWATKGGKRAAGVEEKLFLVPLGEYQARRSPAFVVDPARHPEHEAAAAPRR